MNRSFAITLVVFAAIFGVCLLRYAPPAVRGLEAPPQQFSAARAREIQREISGDGVPRVVGSESNARTREYLKAELERLGWSTSIQSAMSCSRYGTCAAVKNIVATRNGRDPSATAVLMMAHYDSVACSPGAGDDGFGTSAVVEAARALAAGPPLQRTVIVVLTDGEEAGLLGANAFVHQHPLARTVRGVVNVDSRGTGGPSAMFETSPGNGWIVGLLARNVERPVTSSLFYEIYRRMPNDTDFTTVKDLAHGVNFANIARVERYHTPYDSFDNADPRTLQHHGEQALAMVRALADAGPELDAPRVAANDAVWFDVLATFVVRWPAPVSLGLALAALGLIVGWTIRRRTWRSGVRGFAAPLASLVSAALGAVALGGGLHAVGALPVPWVAHPLPALIALHGACVLLGLAIARVVAGASKADALWAGTWLLWGTIGVATAIVVPGASFLFIVPTLAAGLLGWLRVPLATAVSASVAAILWLPLAILVYDGVGLAVPALACISSVVLVSAVPALWVGTFGAAATPTRRRVGAIAAASVAVAAVVASLVPPFSTAVPQRVNVVFRQDHSEEATPPPARVFVAAAWGDAPWGKAPEAMIRALGDPSLVGMDTPWGSSARVPMVEVPRIPRIALPRPIAVTLSTTTSETGWTKRVRLISARRTPTIAIELPTGTSMSIDVGGQTAIPRRDAVVLRAVPPDGIEIVFEHRGKDPVTLTILEVTSGLPLRESAPLARRVMDARPPTAVQTQDGDVTVVTSALQL